MGDDKGFTKTDMERVGIFKEMGYISIKDPYKGKALSTKETLTSDKLLSKFFMLRFCRELQRGGW